MSHPSVPTTTKPAVLFVLGLTIFGLVRFSLVAIPPVALNIPRLGDDALVYLWKGALNRSWYATGSPAVEDVAIQTSLADNPPARVGELRSRVAGRINGTYGPLYDLLPRAALSLHLPLKWTFALTEIVGVLVMAGGIAAFLSVLVGKDAAGVGLLLLAFAILPAQGISSFIPSTLAMSLTLLIWAALLSYGEKVPALLIWGTAALILGIHPIGQLYVLLTVPIHGIALGGARAMLRPRHLVLYGGLVTLALIAAVLPFLIPRLSVLGAGGRGSIALGATFLENIRRVGSHFKDPILRKNVLLVVLLGCALVMNPRAVLTRRIVLVLGVLGAAMVAALFHGLPGYPGELFSRLFVPAVVVAAGLAGRFVVCWVGARIPLPVLVGLGVVSLAGTGVLWVNEWFHALNLRTEVVFEDRVRASLAGLRDGATVLYEDTDTALLVSLLSGGGRFGAIAYPALAGTPSLDPLVQLRQPEVIVVPAFRGLNTLAVQRTKNLTARRHGFFLPAVDRLILRPSPGQRVSDLHLYVRTGQSPVTLRLSGDGSELGRTSLRVERDVSAHFDGWVRVWDPRMVGAPEIAVILPDAWGWIEGIATEPPRDRVRWPWTSEVEVKYHARGRPPMKGGSLVFSVKRLLAENGADELEALVQREAPVVSDDSGLVFLRTIYAEPAAKVGVVMKRR